MTAPSTILAESPVLPDCFCLLREWMSSKELALIGPDGFPPPSSRRFSWEAFLDGIFLFALSGPEPPSVVSDTIDEVLLVLWRKKVEREMSKIIKRVAVEDGKTTLM